MAAGEVGKVGVSMFSLAEAETVFKGIDLSKISTSFTINGTAAIIFAMYCAVADKQGVIRDGANHDGASADEGVGANGDATQNRGIGADGCVCTDKGWVELIDGFFDVTAGISVVGEDAIRAEKNVVLDRDQIPDGDAVFYGDVVA